MAKPRDERSQRFQQEYSDRDFLDAVDRLELPTTTDVADELGCVKATAAGRLNALEDDGELAAKTVGQAKVWRLA